MAHTKKEFQFRAAAEKAAASGEQKSLFSVLPAGARRILCHVGLCLFALLLCALKLSAQNSPFALALVAALPPGFALTTAFGAAAGYILTQSSVSAMRYLAALICAVVLTKLLYTLEGERHLHFMPTLIGFFSAFLTAMAVSAADGFSLLGFVHGVTEGIYTALLTFQFTAAAEALQSVGARGVLPAALLPFLAYSVGILLNTAAEVTVFQISFSRMLGVYLLLLFTYAYGASGGALLGLGLSFAFFMQDAVGIFAPAYAFSALLCGYAAGGRPYKCVLAFCSAFTFCLLLSESAQSLYLLLEAFGGGLLLLLTPKKILRTVLHLAEQLRESKDENPQRTELLLRLQRTSHAMEEIAETLETASAVFAQQNEAMPAEAVQAEALTRQSICEGCPLCVHCQNEQKQEAEEAFAAMQAALRADRLLTAGDLPPVFRSRCPHAEELCDAMNRHFLRITERTLARKNAREIRTVTAQNFKHLCNMLDHLGTELAENLTFDTAAAQIVQQVLYRECDLRTKAVSCTRGAENQLFLDIIFEDREKALRCKTQYLPELEAALATPFNPPCFEDTQGLLHLHLCEQTAYFVEASAAGIIPDNGKYSGDSYESFCDGYGNYLAVLSDGMGQGRRAALDSALAVTFVLKLLKGGTAPQTALELANALLLLKSEEESLATLDILKINLYSGEAVFYKAGGAKSLLKRGRQIQSVEKASLPAGILPEIHTAPIQGNLAAGDVVILASDGAFDYAEKQVEAAFSACAEEPTSEIAKKLSKTALENAPQGHADDITVLALRLHESGKFQPENRTKSEKI